MERMLQWSVTEGKAPSSCIASRRACFNGASPKAKHLRPVLLRMFLPSSRPMRNGSASTVSPTSFADEFRPKFFGFRSTGRHCRVSSSVSSRSDDSLPSSIDWREKDAVVEVNDQGSCDMKDPDSQLYSDLNLKELNGGGQAQNTPTAAERSEEEVRLLYEEWFLKHRKSINDLDEKESRFQVFRDNLKYIDKFNAAAHAGKNTCRLGLNCFSDLTNDEFRSRFCGIPFKRRHRRVSSSSKNDSSKPNRAFADDDGMHSSS